MPKKLDIDRVMKQRGTAAKKSSGWGTRKYRQQKAKLGKELTWAEKQHFNAMGSEKVERELLNEQLKVLFKDPVDIKHLYSQFTRTGPRTAVTETGVWQGVKMKDWMESRGWINRTTLKVWKESETKEMLLDLDRLGVEKNLKMPEDDYLQTMYRKLDPEQQAMFSAWMAEQDWDYLWVEVYPNRNRHIQSTNTGDVQAKRQALYDRVVQQMDVIMRMK